MGHIVDIAGQKFGRLTVLSFAGIALNRKAQWNCICDCGVSCLRIGEEMRHGRVKSCGCLHQEKARERALLGIPNHPVKHGYGKHDRTGTYRAWANMLTRVSNPNFHSTAYDGVQVCERWKQFENFLTDMGERPSSKHTLSRHLDTGNYEPGNVEWGTWADQKSEHYGKIAAQALHRYHQKMDFLFVAA